MTILILSGLVKILHDDKCVLYAITLDRAAHTPYPRNMGERSNAYLLG